jgi:molybdate transport system ATP-binding protein
MAGTLSAEFVKRFPGGAEIVGTLRRVERGVTVLFGPSGCGKTTVLRCLAGLERPDEGQILLGDQVWFDSRNGTFLRPQERGAALVFQDYALFPHLTIERNIAYALQRAPAEERNSRVRDLLERFRLAGCESRRPRELSGGQQQRVALARALAARPRLLLLDEPLSALDLALRENLRAELRHFLAECGVPVLLVTHDRDEALALGDNLVVMSGGRMLQSGPVLEVFNRPASADVAAIVRVETLQSGRVIEFREALATIEVNGVQMLAIAPARQTRDVFVCIRGEDVILQRESSGPSSVRNRLKGKVLEIRPGVPLMRVEVDVGFPLTALVTRPACEELQLAPGVEVTALIKAPAIHLIARQHPV